MTRATRDDKGATHARDPVTFPPRRAVLTFTSEPFNAEGIEVTFAPDALIDVLTERMLDESPGHFLLTDQKPTQVSVNGRFADARLIPVGAGYRFSCRLTLSLRAGTGQIGGQGQYLGAVEEQADKQLAHVLVDRLFLDVRDAIVAALDRALRRVPNETSLNAAPWQAAVILMLEDGAGVVIDHGYQQGILKENVFDVFRPVAADPGPVYEYSATVRIGLPGPAASEGLYTAPPAGPVAVGDIVLLHDPRRGVD